MIFSAPALDGEDRAVLKDVHAMRGRLADALRPAEREQARRWEGGLRRSMLARAIQGSNSIEGYTVEVDDAAAALDDEAPLGADDATFAEIRGYRQALGYVLAMSGDPEFRWEQAAIRGMHFMMLSHSLGKSPGRYRPGPIFVRDGRTGRPVYQGPDAEVVPGLMAELVAGLAADSEHDPLVRAALAHLNLVMIHPFRDGNGRMARAVQTLVLAREGVADPAFSSIEEWLGSNTQDYYRVLGVTGRGAWNPQHDTSLWLKFNLRAHHMQAQTLERRSGEAAATLAALDDVLRAEGLPERVADELYDASIGFRIRRGTYVRRAEIEERTATRDLTRLAELDLIRAVGHTRGRHYVAGPALRAIRAQVVENRPGLTDPYPWMRGVLIAAEDDD